MPSQTLQKKMKFYRLRYGQGSITEIQVKPTTKEESKSQPTIRLASASQDDSNLEFSSEGEKRKAAFLKKYEERLLKTKTPPISVEKEVVPNANELDEDMEEPGKEVEKVDNNDELE